MIDDAIDINDVINPEEDECLMSVWAKDDDERLVFEVSEKTDLIDIINIIINLYLTIPEDLRDDLDKHLKNAELELSEDSGDKVKSFVNNLIN